MPKDWAEVVEARGAVQREHYSIAALGTTYFSILILVFFEPMVQNKEKDSNTR